MGMKDEIEEALQAHAEWRKRFKDYLSGRGAFDITTANATDQCKFGRWLDKEGHRLMPTELHGEIREAHGTFHQVAGDIIQKIKQKRFAEAHEDIAPGGALNRASGRLSELLLRAALREPGGAKPAPAAAAPDAEAATAPPPAASAGEPQS